MRERQLREALQRCQSANRLALLQLQALEEVLMGQQGTLSIALVAEVLGHLRAAQVLLVGEEGQP